MQANQRSGSIPAVLFLGVVGLLLAGTEARSATFLRGDADGNGSREITDAILVLNFLFTGGKPPVCPPLADTTADGDVNISDPVRLLGHLFLGSPTPDPLSPADEAVCGGIDPEAVVRGRMEYENADPNGNLFSCALCHSMSLDSESEVIRVGHSLLNSLGRPSYKGVELDSFVAAVNVCRNDWMVVGDPENNFEFKPWVPEDARFKDLVAFMQSVKTNDTDSPLEFEIVPPAQSGPPATGNALAGCELFNRSCMLCHGMNAAGSELNFAPRLEDVTSLCAQKPDLCLDSNCDPAPDGCLDNPDYIRYRIRLSGPNHPGQVYRVPPGFTLAGSVMPFWSKDKLSDQQVEDLTAYLIELRQKRRAGEDFDCTEMPNPDGNVVRAGKFTTLFHGVKGDVEQLDTRKIRIRNFSFDGGGILVKVWLYSGNNIRGGRAIGDDLFGRPMANTTLVVEIPPEIALDSFDRVSIWCVSARQDFGSAELKPVP